MPAGLDGNPEPVRSTVRDAVLDELCDAIETAGASSQWRVTLVAIDGQSGSGKSTLGDELASRLRSRGRAVVRSTTDSFHNSRAERFPPGVDPAEGYLAHSHDLDTLRSVLLDPMRAGVGVYRSAAFDEPSDAPVDVDPEPVCPGSVLIFDGLFLHRRELREYWDYSIFVTAPERIRRASERYAIVESASGTEALLHLCWWWSVARRYHEGWRLYVEAVMPESIADSVLDNDDLAGPTLTSKRSW